MKIGCNWSRQLSKLLEDEIVEIDYIKAGSWNLEELNASTHKKYPVLLHGLGLNECIGMDDVNIIDFSSVNAMLKKYQSPHIGIHASINNSSVTPTTTMDEIISRMISNINIMKSSFDVPLILENPPDCPVDRTVFDHYPFYKTEDYITITE